MKAPKGEMTMAEIKRTIKKYDDLMGIVIKGKSREELLKEVVSVGYKIDHDGKKFVRKGSAMDKKKRPKEVSVPAVEKKKPVDKTEAMAKKKEMIIKLFVKHPELHKEVMADERVKLKCQVGNLYYIQFYIHLYFHNFVYKCHNRI